MPATKIFQYTDLECSGITRATALELSKGSLYTSKELAQTMTLGRFWKCPVSASRSSMYSSKLYELPILKTKTQFCEFDFFQLYRVQPTTTCLQLLLDAPGQYIFISLDLRYPFFRTSNNTWILYTLAYNTTEFSVQLLPDRLVIQGYERVTKTSHLIFQIKHDLFKTIHAFLQAAHVHPTEVIALQPMLNKRLQVSYKDGVLPTQLGCITSEKTSKYFRIVLPQRLQIAFRDFFLTGEKISI